MFGASEQVLRQHKEADPTRQRRGFEAHLRFIEPQRRYFEAMRSFSPGSVQFLDARSVDENVRAVRAGGQEAGGERQPVELFDSLIEWLWQHPAA